MARPAEKARSMLNKWVALREQGNGATPSFSQRQQRDKRPHLASQCERLNDAERFRGQIIREISDGIAKLQNPALPEHEMRDLNDEINRKLREKWHWNRRIRELGGLDYNAIEKQRQIEEGGGQQHASSGGYRYFGVAKTLPGVPELLAKEEEQRQKKTLKQHPQTLFNQLTPDYYGWRDEEDGILLELETALLDTQEQEQQMDPAHGKKPRTMIVVDKDDDEGAHEFLAAVPSQEQVSKILLQQKKKALLRELGI